MIFKKNRIPINYILFIIIATLLYVPFIAAGFNTYPLHNLKDIVYILGQCFAITTVTLIVVSILSLHKFIFALFYPILIILSSILGFYAWTMNTSFTVMILDATLHNDWKTSYELISVSLILVIVTVLILSIVLIKYRFEKIKEIRYWPLLFVILLGVLISLNYISKVKNLISNHIPFNIFYVCMNYFEEQNTISEIRGSISEGSHCKADSLTVVFVIGESLRADHLQMNGYTRNTTPQLSSLKNVISLTNIYTPYTHTIKSLPFIFTRADSLNPEIAYSEPSFIDIFNACGFKSSWLANQEPARSYIYFMHECDTLIYASTNKSVYNLDKWLDESLIPHYEEQLKTSSPKKLIILHTIGSHWWYNSHFTDEFTVFQPTIKSKIISSNTKEEMINSYDNTVLYTDNFLRELIQRIKNDNSILIYLSDHGESLGEDNIWLHAADSYPMHYPACIIWMSDKYLEKNSEKYSALKQNRERNYTTSFLFHSILDAASISSPYLKDDLNIFKQ